MYTCSAGEKFCPPRDAKNTNSGGDRETQWGEIPPVPPGNSSTAYYRQGNEWENNCGPVSRPKDCSSITCCDFWHCTLFRQKHCLFKRRWKTLSVSPVACRQWHHAAGRAYALHRAANINTTPSGEYSADRNSAAHVMQWVTLSFH